MERIILVFSDSPVAIKMSPLVKEIQKHPGGFKTMLCVTGQHREILNQVLRILEIKTDYELDIVRKRMIASA